MTTTTALKIVDQLGLIEDQIAALQEQAEDFKNQLKILGKGSYAGTLYVTTIKHTPEKKTTAWSAVAKELKKAGIPIGSSKQSADVTAAIDLAAQCGSRNALATWAADTMAESLDDAEREVAAMVFEFLHLDQPGVVDGRAFTAWTTANHIAKAADSGVDLLTFHGAKGREWNCVVVAGAESGLLPHGSATSTDQKKEEIRLAYVALTRAANQLYVTYAEKRGSRNAGLSPLLEGLPKRAPSPEELAREEAAAAVRAAMPRTNSGQPTVLDKLTTWRRHLARSSNLTPQEICTDADLLEL